MPHHSRLGVRNSGTLLAIVGGMHRSSTQPGREPCPPLEMRGNTRVGACCTFEWTQRGILRSVYVDETKHYECVQELLAMADADRLSVLLVYRQASAATGGR